MGEVANAINQANREVDTRFDFKGKDAKFELDGDQITMSAPNEFQLNQMYDILAGKLAGRKVNIGSLKRDPVQVNVSDAWQIVWVRQGIDTNVSRQLVKIIKETKIKVQVAIQGDKLRVTGKKRDALQEIIVVLKEVNIDLPLQYTNYRD